MAQSSEEQLTPNTPASTESLIDESDQGTGNDTRETAACVEKPDLRRCGIVQVLVPGIQSLETGDDRTVICTYKRSDKAHDGNVIYAHPLRIIPTKMTLRKLAGRDVSADTGR